MKIRVMAGLLLGSLAFTACSSAPTATTSATSGTTASSAASSASAAASTAAASPSATASAPAGSQAGVLTIWCDDKRAAALKDVAAAFGQKNSIQVNIQAVSKDLQSTFVTASQAGNAPDIVVGAHDWIGNMVQNGAISPITISNKDAYDAKAVAGVTYDGQTYGVPYTRNNIALIRNTELAPTAPATLDDLVKTGQDLKAAGKTSEVLSLQVGQTGDVYHMQPLMAAGGGSFFTYDAATGKWDASKLTLDSPQTIAAMEKVKALGTAGVLKTSIGSENAISTFTSKKAAYLISGPWAITDIKKAGIKYDISAIPTWNDGGKPAAPFYGADAFFVAAKGKNAALAQEFVTNYIGAADAQVALYNAEPRPPALTAALDKVKGSDPDLQKFLDAGKDAIPMPAIPAMGKVWDPVGKAEAAIVGGADVTTTLKAATATLKSSIG